MPTFILITMPRFLLALLLLLSGTACAFAQQDAYEAYINRYKKMAMEQMWRYRIPASITLAQGLLESNAGRSTLATEANNHFGIKVGGTWTGPYVLRTDDAPNERFRKYRSVAESFEDHSLFLSARGRYSSLFQLAPNDYQGWAHGLKSAGYATNPRYGHILINLIERYNLTQYDRPQKSHNRQEDRAFASGRTLYLCNDLVYVVARQGDTFERIADDLDLKASRLRRYNEVDETYRLNAGDIVYLAKKKKHVVKPLRKTFHKVMPGESMYSIAQRYGIRTERLYKWNYKSPDYAAETGELIYLR